MAFEQQKQTQLVLQAREHRAQAIRLLSEANALAPVARLPVEVLGRILVFVRDAVASSGSYTDAHWTVVTLVCGLWNSVALRTPQFWSVISFTWTNTPFAANGRAELGHFASECGMAPLDVLHSFSGVAEAEDGGK
jgi:hypothetical protein